MGKRNNARVVASMNVDVPTSDTLSWDDERIASLAHAYYANADIFYLREAPVQPADNLHVGRYAVLRLHPETNEVLGAHVEGWEQVIKPHLANDRQARTEETAAYNLSLMHRILNWLRESEGAAPKPVRAQA